jgi:FkbM family methyltransferase
MPIATLRRMAGQAKRNFLRKTDSNRGADFIADIKTHLSGLSVATVFDVGAHIGMTALEFSDRLPTAVVYAFEPSPKNFQRMADNLVGKPEIRRFQIGFGAQPAQAKLFMDPDHPSMARLNAKEPLPFEQVEIATLDQFCSEQSIATIDILKIDTEGHEIAVLEGAAGLLAEGRILMIKAECTVNPDNTYHTPFSALCDVLYPNGYRLFAIYEQTDNPRSPGPRLHRFDATFISPKLPRASDFGTFDHSEEKERDRRFIASL